MNRHVNMSNIGKPEKIIVTPVHEPGEIEIPVTAPAPEQEPAQAPVAPEPVPAEETARK